MNYYLKNSDATRMYRIDYSTDTDGHIRIGGAYACATGTSAVTPDGNPISEPDVEVETSQVLVDLIVNSLVAGTVTEYRTRAKAMIDAEWS